MARFKKHSEGSSIYRMVSDSVIAAAAVAHHAEKNRFSSRSSSAIEVAKCECCGLGEECTSGYVKRVQQQFRGHFVCGLCAEAVKEEQARINSRMKAKVIDDGSEEPARGGDENRIEEDAINTHMKICKQFNCAVRENPVAAATTAMRQLLLRRSGGGSPRLQKSLTGLSSSKELSRSTSCIPALVAKTLN